MHYNIDLITHGMAFDEPVGNTRWGQVYNMPTEFHLSETNGSCRARTWTACLTDREVNHYAIFPPPHRIGKRNKNVEATEVAKNRLATHIL